MTGNTEYALNTVSYDMQTIRANKVMNVNLDNMNANIRKKCCTAQAFAPKNRQNKQYSSISPISRTIIIKRSY